MESWRAAWRAMVAAAVGQDRDAAAAGLEALAVALAAGSPDLLRGQTTEPPPLLCVQDWPVEGADPVAYLAWKGRGLGLVGEVEEAFATLCHECDVRLGEPAACRYFLNWWDRECADDRLARGLLLAEVAFDMAGLRGEAAEDPAGPPAVEAAVLARAAAAWEVSAAAPF